MYKFLYLIILVFLFYTGSSQAIPPDYNNPVVNRKQGLTTEKFMKMLEQGRIDSAMKFIDPSFIKTKGKYRDSLFAFHKELVQYLKSTELSIMLVYPEKEYNTYRCRYYTEKGEFFYIDLYYNVGQPNSPITRISKKPAKELAKERKELAERVKEEEGSGPPQPPPPPPGMTPVKKK